jgi:hypothetical protein
MEKFIPQKSLDTAVLFLIFNRLDTTKQVFNAIKKAKPPKLYIASDGARKHKKNELKIVEEIREFVLKNIDWHCEIKTLFRNENLGCKKAVSDAITWFFNNEEQGIILEDDCLPTQSFFWYCEELLNKYKNDLRIWHISGNNFHFGWTRDNDYSYYFSYYGSIWGWATWKSRWKEYDVNIRNYNEIKNKNYLWDLFGNQIEANFRYRNLDEILKGLDTWDYQWAFARFINSGLSIVPLNNLVKNLGFGKEATHTNSKNDKRANMSYYDIKLPLKHPTFIIRDKISDDKFFKDFVKNSYITYNIKKIIKKVLKK